MALAHSIDVSPIEERRRHKLLRTNNTEYHLRDRKCVAVYDVRAQSWVNDHLAVGADYVASMGNGSGIRTDGLPLVGDRLFFSSDVMTSPVQAVERPAKSSLVHYI